MPAPYQARLGATDLTSISLQPLQVILVRVHRVQYPVTEPDELSAFRQRDLLDTTPLRVEHIIGFRLPVLDVRLFDRPLLPSFGEIDTLAPDIRSAHASLSSSDTSTGR